MSGGGGGTYSPPSSAGGFTQNTFDSKAYLAANPDVADEINRGVANFGDAYGHYARYGMNEGRQGFALPPPTPFASMAVNTQQGYDTLMQAKGQPWEQSGGVYNNLLNQGFTSGQIRDSATQLFGAPSSANWNAMVQHAGMVSPTGRPMAGSDQFYQPVYQQQYQNYAMTNPLGVSQYGQSFGGYGGGYYGGMGGYGMQMQTPFNPYTNSFQSPFAFSQQPQVNYGPSQQIVSRSAGVRGTPNVIRRAEGGIASLVGDE